MASQTTQQIIFEMEPQQLPYQREVDLLYAAHNPHPREYCLFEAFLVKECKGSDVNIGLFLDTLYSRPIVPVNFAAFAKYVRLLRRILLRRSRDQQLLFSSYLVRCARVYFPYQITRTCEGSFRKFLRLLGGLPLLRPHDLSDQRSVIISLQSEERDEEWEHRLVEQLVSEVLVDKKNQSDNPFKLNSFFGKLLVRHFPRIYPQLERLMIRSESNIEVWQEILATVVIFKHIDPHVMPLLNRIKHLFVTHAQFCISIVNTVTRHLEDHQTIKSFLDFLFELLVNEQNLKRKIIYVRMLSGVISALKELAKEQLHLQNLFCNEILVQLANSWIKFNEEEQFLVMGDMLDSLLPQISEPTDQLAQICRGYLKNTNKYLQLLIGLSLCSLYKRTHLEILPTVKQLCKHYKVQLAAQLKKGQINWQVLLPFLSFVAESQETFVDFLYEDSPLFKVSCLSLSKLEKKNALRLIARKIERELKEDGQIPDYIFLTAASLLEDVKERAIWNEFLQPLQDKVRVSLIAKGIYPLLLFRCAELNKNRGRQFSSLMMFVVASLTNRIPTSEASLDKILFAGHVLQVDLSRKVLDDHSESLDCLLETYVTCVLFDSDNDDKQLVSNQQKNIFLQQTNSILKCYTNDFLVTLLASFLNPDDYQKDLSFLGKLEERARAAVQWSKQELARLCQVVSQRGFYREEPAKPRKTYPSHIVVKMMSEIEVKKEKYRKHFAKMLTAFCKIIGLLMPNLRDRHLLCSLWETHFQKLVRMTQFAGHRMELYRLIRRSFEMNAWHNKSTQQAKLFIRYANFLADFFSIRFSELTPPVGLMEKCHHYLRDLLDLPFEDSLQKFPLIEEERGQFIMLFVNDLCEYVLENMEFDINLKRYAIKFYYKCQRKRLNVGHPDTLYTYVVKNINILSSCEHIKSVLACLLSRVDTLRHKELFADILSFVQPTKLLILETISKLDGSAYSPEFEEYIKLKILALEENEDISRLARGILHYQGDLGRSIVNFNMKSFVKKNSKETIEKLCVFVKESMSEETCEAVYALVMRTSEELFDQNFDQEGLEMFPYFLGLNIDSIKESLFKPIFELLVTKFTAKGEYPTLSKLSLDVGIEIIKKNAQRHAPLLLQILEGFINQATGVSNIIFLGVLAPFLEANKNLQIIERRITELFKGKNEDEQRSISKCMPDLMSFFKQPSQLVDGIYCSIGQISDALQVGQAYLFSGLLKGIGRKESLVYLDRLICEEYVAKSRSQKLGRIMLLNAIICNFGRFVEVRAVRICEILIALMADAVEDIRNAAKRVGQSLIVKLSSYSVKKLLPHLLRGLQDEQNWRMKISYIWILGIMANCSARQFQTSLPIIVPSLSSCLSNAHPTIRDKAAEALNLIGETIKNPEISQCIDILIEALQSPFDRSDKAIELLKQTRFSHYIDAPSLSIIIPILDYCMRGRSSELKAGACQIMGSVVQLIQNPQDLLPYIRIINTGLKVALCDPLPEIRSIASMAIGRIATKIGVKEAENCFHFVIDIIECPTSNTTQRQGAAQAYSELICSSSYEYFEESINKIFDKLNEVKHSEKEGYILVFLYVPTIRTQQFEEFIKDVNGNMYAFVSNEDEHIRNSAMQVEKVLINNYCLSHTDLLLDPLCDGVFENNWRKRNAALFLLGELLNIIKNHMYNTRSNDKAYAYYRALMAVYIIKDDELEMPRVTAQQVWNAYIDNTPKTIRAGLPELVKMWTRWTHSANGAVLKNIVAFSGKYAENYFYEILQHLQSFLKDSLHQKGVFEVLCEFVKRMNQQFLAKEQYKSLIRDFFLQHVFTVAEEVKGPLAKCLALYVEKMHEEIFFENLIYPEVDRMDTLSEQSPEYSNCLHLMKDFLHTSSPKVVDRIIAKTMQTPLSEFKIQVITNNADRLANHLYTHFDPPATHVLVEEIYVLVDYKEKENRLALIIYCLSQVSLKLNDKNKGEFIKMVLYNIRKLLSDVVERQHPRSSRIILIFLGMLAFFMNSTLISEQDNFETLIGELAHLVFITDPSILALVHKIYLILLADVKERKTALYYRQLVVSLENNARVGHLIWKERDITKDYISAAVKGLAYGCVTVMDESIQLLQFLMRFTTRDIVEQQIVRIVGPIIRVLNYSLAQKQKICLMECLTRILEQKYDILIYTPQLLSVGFRLLHQFKTSEDILDAVAKAQLQLLVSCQSQRRNGLALTILAKVSLLGGNFVKELHLLVDKILSQHIELHKSTFEKMYDELKTLLHARKLTVEEGYYASMTVARLGVLLAKPIEAIEAQLHGMTCSYETLLNYLHFAHCKDVTICRMDKIEIFLRESPRQKVYYLLKTLKASTDKTTARTLFTQTYLRHLVPEHLSGFEEIADVLEDFEGEEQSQLQAVQEVFKDEEPFM